MSFDLLSGIFEYFIYLLILSSYYLIFINKENNKVLFFEIQIIVIVFVYLDNTKDD